MLCTGRDITLFISVITMLMRAFVLLFSILSLPIVLLSTYSLFSPSSSVSLLYFTLAVPMCKCSGKYSCTSSPVPIGILNGTCFFCETGWLLLRSKICLLKLTNIINTLLRSHPSATLVTVRNSSLAAARPQLVQRRPAATTIYTTQPRQTIVQQPVYRLASTQCTS